MSNVLKCLKIHNIGNLYLKSKLSFLNSLKYNELSMYIFNNICEELNDTPKKSISFKKDILLLRAHFNADIESILAGADILKKSLNDTFKESDGISDSIMTCLKNIKRKQYKKMLNDLVRPDFLNEYSTNVKKLVSLF